MHWQLAIITEILFTCILYDGLGYTLADSIVKNEMMDFRYGVSMREHLDRWRSKQEPPTGGIGPVN